MSGHQGSVALQGETPSRGKKPGAKISAGMQAFLRGSAGLLTCALVWEAIGRAGVLSRLFFVPLSDVLAAGWDMYASGFIFTHLGYTLGNFSLGFIIGVVTGVPAGLAIGWNRKLFQYFDPIISVGLATPVIVLVPLLIAMFGIFWQSKVAITAWAVFFPILVATIAGIQSVDAGLVKVARSFQASDLKIIANIVLPGAVPSLVSGVRLGLTRGLVGALAAEFFGSQKGLGYLAFNYSASFQTAKMFVAILTMALVGVLLSELIKMAQNHFDAWRPERD